MKKDPRHIFFHKAGINILWISFTVKVLPEYLKYLPDQFFYGFFIAYSKVTSSRPVYYSIFDHFVQSTVYSVNDVPVKDPFERPRGVFLGLYSYFRLLSLGKTPQKLERPPPEYSINKKLVKH